MVQANRKQGPQGVNWAGPFLASGSFRFGRKHLALYELWTHQSRLRPVRHLAPEQDLCGRLLNIVVVANARGAAGGELTVQAMINVAREDSRSLLCFETLLDPPPENR